MPVEIGCSQLRSGSAQCDLQLAVEIQQCPVRSGGRGRKEGRQEGRKAGRKEGRQAGSKAGRQAGREASKQGRNERMKEGGGEEL